MIYFSIPVHENIPVIINQMQNLAAYAPQVRVVLHRSAQAAFSHHELASRLDEAGLRHCTVNPHSVPTAWSGIIEAHLANIRCIRQRGDATLITFHSSNDMLVRGGVADFMQAHRNCLHQWPVFAESYWWPGPAALQDTALAACLRHLGTGRLVGSQIEGSVYQAEVLYEIADLAQDDRFSPSQPGPRYPREEIWFSTLATALGVRPSAFPYVFSELQRFDAKAWGLARVSQRLPRWLGQRFVRRGIIDLCRYLPREQYVIGPQDVRAVREISPSLERYCIRRDGTHSGRVYHVENLYGLKRIARDCEDPVRKYISGLPLDVSEEAAAAVL
ncbi:MAG: hypothetical protein AB7O62_22245 [Pirellulales bacterium]